MTTRDRFPLARSHLACCSLIIVVGGTFKKSCRASWILQWRYDVAQQSLTLDREITRTISNSSARGTRISKTRFPNHLSNYSCVKRHFTFNACNATRVDTETFSAKRIAFTRRFFPFRIRFGTERWWSRERCDEKKATRNNSRVVRRCLLPVVIFAVRQKGGKLVSFSSATGIIQSPWFRPVSSTAADICFPVITGSPSHTRRESGTVLRTER